jgi:hypothetical protein
MILPISASQVAKITGMSHRHPADFMFSKTIFNWSFLFYFFKKANMHMMKFQQYQRVDMSPGAAFCVSVRTS